VERKVFDAFPERKLKFRSWVGLLSKKGCRQQHWHTDYDCDALATMPDESVPFSVLLALQDQTFLDVIPKSIRLSEPLQQPTKLQLNPGDVVVFRGDLVHAGSAYPNEENYRIHAYVDPVNFKRKRNATYLIKNVTQALSKQ
jgi:ectoine hydroxylase-related dioxygenase (phytanoyl-CoA dioxygenase family)